LNILLNEEQWTNLNRTGREEGRPLPNVVRRILDLYYAPPQLQTSQTYAEMATHLLMEAGRPMDTTELLDAMTAKGRPVNGKTRKHRISTLIISLNRASSVERQGTGWWLRGVPVLWDLRPPPSHR